jgi:hypothetical protein
MVAKSEVTAAEAASPHSWQVNWGEATVHPQYSQSVRERVREIRLKNTFSVYSGTIIIGLCRIQGEIFSEYCFLEQSGRLIFGSLRLNIRKNSLFLNNAVFTFINNIFLLIFSLEK